VNSRSLPTSDSYRVEEMRGKLRPQGQGYFSSLEVVISPKRKEHPPPAPALRGVPHSMERVGWARFKKRWVNTRLRAASYWMGCHLSS
jgi:hypothetical protein